MNSLATSLLSANELHTSALRIDTIVIGELSKEIFVLKVEPLLKASTSELEKSLSRVTDHSQVQQLSDKDKVRDTRYITLRNFCKAFSTDADAQLANAGITLTAIFKGLGWSMHLRGYAEESSKLQALFLKLDEPSAKAALTTIGVGTRLADLKTAQADFEKTFNEKVSSKAQEDYMRIRQARLAVARYLDSLISYIDIMAEIDKGIYSIALAKINEVITESEAIGRARETKAETEKKETGATTK